MTTTPTTHRGIWVESIALPTGLVATDSVISWSSGTVSGPVRLRGGEWTDADLAGTDTLLSDFIDLAAADPEQMAGFMKRYGILELCGEHGQPDGHNDGLYCPLLDVDNGQRCGVLVRTVRRAARAFADLQQWGQAVREGQKPPAGSGHDVQLLMPGFWFRNHVITDRERIAHHLTRLNRETGVRPLVTWDERLTVNHAAGGLLGVLAILLTREIMAPGIRSFRCSVCGDLVDRGRPPQPDEAIYCTKPSCKREQRRRNQAAWRARTRAEGKS
jgi:hypothetical protein